ncbi:PilZ domain-containing protein [Legionella sp. CNM-4043-24]|uniref:PilZ domain-containing protein n=1 Tax=Legionella sp. CNM-4043-24 TaxID=3421646 RepID=UPI00403ACBC4
MNEELQSINCSFPTEALLYQAYMPFLHDGGLFVRSNYILPLGTMVRLEFSLLNEAELYVVEAKVVWITPRGAQGNKPAGLGFQFKGENSRSLCNKIETCLAGMLKSTQMTDTM